MGAFCLRYLSQIFRNLRHIIVSISLGANTNNCHYFAHTQFYPDRAVQRDVMEMLVKCENHSMGCPWTGQLKNWEVRREGDNVYVGWKGEGKDRYVERQHTEVLLSCSSLLPPSQNHIDACVFRAVTCPNKGCKAVLPYHQLESHEQNCSFRRVTCEHCHTEITISELEVKI